MKNISLFKNFITEIGSQSLDQIIEEIRGDRYKSPISKIRALVDIGDHKNANELKKELVTFTVSGLFGGGPKLTSLKIYNPFVILDINGLDPDILPYLVLEIKEIEFTKAVFKSPSGRGLKVIVEADADMEMHSLVYRQVCNFYKKRLRVEIENSGGLITQLCFMSYDPEAYFNPNNTVYKITKPDVEISTEQEPTDFIPDRAPDLTNEETVNNTYKRASFEFVNKTKQRSRKRVKDHSTALPPAIPLQVYSKLPALLKKSCKPFKDQHQKRDVFLTGALGVLSGLLSGISGTYNGRIYHPNLFVFVTAPSGSGKGTFKLAKYLGTAHQKQLLQVNKKQQEVYVKAMAKFETDLKKYKKGLLKREPQSPENPGFKNIFIPPSTKATNLIEYLNQNEASGILFGSEADSLVNAINQGWGEYSDMLRKAFHHEPLLYSRTADKSLTEINCPKLSVAFSGTPNQLTKLIQSADDGLLSRFMFYAFDSGVVWEDVSPKGMSPNLQMVYEELSKDVSIVIDFLKVYPAEFMLTDAQWKTLNATFKKLMKETEQDFGTEALSIVNRMGLNCFRIAMVLSAIRKYQEKRLGTKLVCHKNDFQAAILLAETYLKHGLFVYENLRRSSKKRSSFRNVGV